MQRKCISLYGNTLAPILSVNQTARFTVSVASIGRRSSSPSRTFRPKVAPKKTLEDLVVPVRLVYEENSCSQNAQVSSDSTKKDKLSRFPEGLELTGGEPLTKLHIGAILNKFLKRPEVRLVCEQSGLGSRLFNQAFLSFRRYCFEVNPMPPELYVLLHDLHHESSQFHVDDLLPYFMTHAKRVYPHLDCLNDLKKISDLRCPPNWYPEARTIQRKIVFHAGPTNSGKTYQALKRFMEAESGVYCGPLKLLAAEVYHKTNEHGVDCDLITGEERRAAYKKQNISESEPSKHLACTVEMLSVNTPFEVAIIDEIQMLRDPSRGWAWTRALLGVVAKEVHVCGEAAAIDVVQELLFPVNETVECFRYNRMTALKVADEAVNTFNNIRDGDCIVAFNKNDIYRVSRQIEKLGREVALIYGSLPPSTKLAQAKNFNDPQHPCKVMVATDAIGMGLNLSIQRIIFWSLYKPNRDAETGLKSMELLSTSTALQISGRAGRFGTGCDVGEVTTFKSSDLPMLKDVLACNVEKIEKAGLHPTVDQIEMFAFYLPKATLCNLMDIFVSLCSVDESKYFMCNVDDFKTLASSIEHVSNLSIKIRYVICQAPVSVRNPFVLQQFVKFASKFATGQPLTWDWLKDTLEWKDKAKKPQRLADLTHLESMFDVMDLYLWLGYRFIDSFPDPDIVRAKQTEIDHYIKEGIVDIAALLRNTVTSSNKDSKNKDSCIESVDKDTAKPFVEATLSDAIKIPTTSNAPTHPSGDALTHSPDPPKQSIRSRDLLETMVIEKNTPSKSNNSVSIRVNARPHGSSTSDLNSTLSKIVQSCDDSTAICKTSNQDSTSVVNSTKKNCIDVVSPMARQYILLDFIEQTEKRSWAIRRGTIAGRLIQKGLMTNELVQQMRREFLREALAFYSLQDNKTDNQKPLVTDKVVKNG